MKLTKQEWIQSLQPGEEVVVLKWGYRSSEHIISTVKKITATGRITTENGYTFLPSGEEYGKKRDPWSIAAKLEMPTQEIRDGIKRKAVLAQVRSAKFEELSLETLEKILKLASGESDPKDIQ